MNIKKVIISLIIIVIITISSIILYFHLSFPTSPPVRTVGGTIQNDEIWSGIILVTDNVLVSEEATLTVLPGTIVKFKHYRGYEEAWKKYGLMVMGTIKAIGTSEQQIWFTSDAEPPMNGDWAGIVCESSNTSEFKYVIVEYGEIGIAQFDSAINISHSIVRWTNTEGLYAERSKPIYEYNLLYENAYHGIALEQYNYEVQIRYNIFKGGHYGVHAEATNVTIIGNYFLNFTYNGITGCQNSNFIIANNTFENIEEPIALELDTSSIILNNDYFGNESLPIPSLDFPDTVKHDLGYIPGDPEDQYLYVFPSEDETRRVKKRIESQNYFGWTLTYKDGFLWRFCLDNLVRIDPTTEVNQTYSTNFITNPRGLTHDGEFFYVNDFTDLKIYKFKINATNQVVLNASFDIPHKAEGGVMGLMCDGTYLYTPGRYGAGLYKINKSTGALIEEITIEVGGAIVWTGPHFWTASGNFWEKYWLNGTLAGKIYAPAVGTIALAWDGLYFWSVHKTCEMWRDAKIFQVEILNEQVLLE